MTYKNILNLITITILLTLAVYHFFIFFGRKKESYYLFFALLGLALSSHIYFADILENQQLSIVLVHVAIFLTITLSFITVKQLIDFPKIINIVFYVCVIILLLITIISFPTLILGRQWYYDNLLLICMVGTAIAGLTLIVATIVTIIIQGYWRDPILVLVVLGLIIYAGNGILSGAANATNSGIIAFFKHNYILTGVFYFIFTMSLAMKFNLEYTELHKTTSQLEANKRELVLLNKDLDNKVIERTAELNSALNFKSNLLTTTAHHTKTPLTLIKNGFHTLFTLYPELEKNKQLQMLKRNADLMTRDIVNIFDMAQLEQGKRLCAESKTFNFGEMLKDKVELFGDSARLKGIHLSEDIADDLFVEADDLALNRVVDNLLDNAIKYCAKDTTIIAFRV